jgi:hypothetical protein
MSQRQIPTLAGIANSDTANNANTIVERDASGDIYCNKIRSSAGAVISGASYGSTSAKTASFSATDAAGTYICDATSAAITATLPAAAVSSGLILTFKKTDNAHNVVVDGNASETIDGAATKTITTQYGFLTVQCNGTAWYIIASGGTIS